MKFAKDLERQMVPEWRAKYMNYKQAKKRLKTVHRLYRTAFPSPNLNTQEAGLAKSQNSQELLKKPTGDEKDRNVPSKHIPIQGQSSENQRLVESQKDDVFPYTHYGSIVGTPSGNEARSFNAATEGELPPLELPDAALGTKDTIASIAPTLDQNLTSLGQAKDIETETINSVDVAQVSSTDRRPSQPTARRPTLTGTPKHILGLISGRLAAHSPASPRAQDEFQASRVSFLGFLTSELEKVDSFYKEKEAEALERLPVLREQLHLMRDRRIHDIRSMRARKKKANVESVALAHEAQPGSATSNQKVDPIKSVMNAITSGTVGKNSKALESMATPYINTAVDSSRDYTRKPPGTDVPYRSAKRKLKAAFQEFHRSIDLLKSFSLLNQTAFRKINKKYDKLTNSRPVLQFFKEEVLLAHFATSDVADRLSQEVEDLYARYFERGSHKVAASKLRPKPLKGDEFSGILLLDGVLIGIGLMMAVEGIIKAVAMMERDDGWVSGDEGLFDQLGVDVKYLLQIYGGYFLASLLSLIFCAICWFWTVSKINYSFIFEFNPRNKLDWRELLFIPSMFFSLLGFFVWLNFSEWGSPSMFLWYPVVLIGVSVFLLCMPFPLLFPSARRWFLVACWRLFFSSLYPVEFRDFFLGDMFCSLLYTMGNISLFFCLYTRGWDSPNGCNSNSSRLMGFFTTLPAIWRALQCIRRFKDTRNAFPHLANFGKYVFTILSYMALSLYRIDRTTHAKALFITFSAINSVYGSLWDLLMDWSLLDLGSENFLLRDTLGYKSKWIYYVAMSLDPILRCTWIFYVIFPLDIQHSAVLAFVMAVAEVLRRGMWTVFRVENEHCSNVGRFRASRDVPLPYHLSQSAEGSQHADEDDSHIYAAGGPDTANGAALEAGMAGKKGSVRHRAHAALASSSPRPIPGSAGKANKGKEGHRPASGSHPSDFSPLIRTLSHVAHHFHAAHVQDFERKKEPEEKADLDPDEDELDEDDEDVDDSTAAGPSGGAAAQGRNKRGLHRRRLARRAPRQGLSDDEGSDEDDDDDDDKEVGAGAGPSRTTGARQPSLSAPRRRATENVAAGGGGSLEAIADSGEPSRRGSGDHDSAGPASS